MNEKLLDYLKKLRTASDKLDVAFCDLLQHGECKLTASEYEELNSLFIEVDEYLQGL